jgi:hypothetical protein
MKKKLDLGQLQEVRKQSKRNQKDFWNPFGVTQSGGSRYESGRKLAKPLALLIHFWQAGKITDADLGKAAVTLGWAKKPRGQKAAAK